MKIIYCAATAVLLVFWGPCVEVAAETSSSSIFDYWATKSLQYVAERVAASMIEEAELDSSRDPSLNPPTSISSSRSHQLRVQQVPDASTSSNLKPRYLPSTDFSNNPISPESAPVSSLAVRALQQTADGQEDAQNVSNARAERQKKTASVCGSLAGKVVGGDEPSKFGQDVVTTIDRWARYTTFRAWLLDFKNNDNSERYVASVFKFLTPSIFGAILLVIVWPALAIASCSRGCRRCCFIFPEPSERKERNAFTRIIFFTVVGLLCCGVVMSAGFIFAYNDDVHDGHNRSLCAAYELSTEVLYGADRSDTFIGVLIAKNEVSALQQDFALERAPGSTEPTLMEKVDTIMTATQDFEDDITEVRQRMSFLETVAAVNGRVASDFDHVCAACSAGVTIATEGRQALDDGLAGAADDLRSEVRETLGPGSPASKTVNSALEVAQNVLNDTAVYFRQTFEERMDNGLDRAQKWERSRYGVVLAYSIFGTLIAVWTFVMLLFQCCTQVENPHPFGSCVSWCSFAFIASTSLLMAGVALTAGVVLTHTCVFLRTDLQTERGMRKFGSAFNFQARSVDVAKECLTMDGEGDLLKALNLGNELDFESSVNLAMERVDALRDERFEISSFEAFTNIGEELAPIMISDPQELTNRPTFPELVRSTAVFSQGNVTISSRRGIPPDLVGLTFIGLREFQRIMQEKSTDAGSDAFYYFTVLYSNPPQFGGQPATTAQQTSYGIGPNFDPDSASVTAEATRLYTDEPDQIQFRNMIYWAAQKAKLLDTTTPRFDCRDYTESDVVASCPLDSATAGTETFVNYIGPNLFAPVVTAAQQLEIGVNAAVQRIGVELGGLIKDTLDRAKVLRDRSNCRGLLKPYNGALDAGCGHLTTNFVRLCVAGCCMGVFSAVLMFLMYAEWRFTVDNRLLLDEEEKYGPRRPQNNSVIYPNGPPPAIYNGQQPPTTYAGGPPQQYGQPYQPNSRNRNSLVMV